MNRSEGTKKFKSFLYVFGIILLFLSVFHNFKYFLGIHSGYVRGNDQKAINFQQFVNSK